MVSTSSLESAQTPTEYPTEQVWGLWAWLKEKVDPAFYRPMPVPDVVVSPLAGRDGDYYVLKSPAHATYLHLSARDFFLWERMDGTRTVKDLVVAYFLEYGSFAFVRAAGLVQKLKAGYFLVEQPANVYQGLRRRLEARRTGYHLGLVFRAFVQRQFAIRGLDRLVTGLYRWLGRWLFTWPVQLVVLGVSALGLYAFARIFATGQYGLVTIDGSLPLGIAGFVVANLAAALLHEMSHALTVKHYGCEVNRGGLMIFFGLPAAFVDTTDIWLQGKRARLAVTWAGPYSGLFLGGLSSICMLLWPNGILNPLLFQFAFLTYLNVLFNLNPLLELDGYYLLMDWLEIPMLRRRSLDFIRTGLWQKLKSLDDTRPVRALAAFSREERIFAVFGLLSAVWTAYAILMAFYFWQRRLGGAVRDLWTNGGNAGKIVLSVAVVALGLLFLVSMGLAVLRAGRRLFARAARRGLFANGWYVAGMLLALVAVLASLPILLDYSVLAPLLETLALGLGSALAWRAAWDRAGSRLFSVFALLGSFSVLLALQGLAIMVANLYPLYSQFLDPAAHTLEFLANLALLVAGLRLFAGTDLRELHAVEKGLLGLGLLLGYGLVYWLASTRQTTGIPPVEMLLSVSRSLAPLLVLTLLVPTLVSFWRTAYGPAWLALALSLAGFLAVALLGSFAVLPALLLAVSFLLYHLTGTRASYLMEQREAEFDLSDQRRLQRAFDWTVSSILVQFRQVAGERSARVLAERFNNYALAAGWRVSIAKDRVEDYLPETTSLIERGERYAVTLPLLLDLVAQETGERSTLRALQRAYDGLPWEEREIGAQYLFRNVKRAEVLSQAFQVTRRDHQGLLRRMPLFATMSEREVELLVARLKSERHASGKVIVRQGEVGDRFYIVRQGHVEVTQRDQRGVTQIVNQLDRGDYFGEVALLRDAPRNATCRATVPTETLSLGRHEFDMLVKNRFALRDKVDRSLARAELLRRLPLFAELDGLQIQHVAARLQEEGLEPGVMFIQQGELGEAFYVIESGRVEVFVSENEEKRLVVERGPGEYVGEIALLLRVPRTASVRTLEPTRLLVLQKSDFDRLVGEHLFVSRGLEQESSRRMIDLRRAVPQG
jgi:putative peptide zinc metalloprotease protein